MPPTDPTTLPFANWAIGPLNLTVTAAQPGLIKVTQGNGQSAAPGQALATALQVEVDTASGTPVAGQQVNWTVTPAGAANLSSTTTSTDVERPDVGHRDFREYRFGRRSNHSDVPRLPSGGQVRDFQRHGGSPRDRQRPADRLRQQPDALS